MTNKEAAGKGFLAGVGIAAAAGKAQATTGQIDNLATLQGGIAPAPFTSFEGAATTVVTSAGRSIQFNPTVTAAGNFSISATTL